MFVPLCVLCAATSLLSGLTSSQYKIMAGTRCTSLATTRTTTTRNSSILSKFLHSCPNSFVAPARHDFCLSSGFRRPCGFRQPSGFRRPCGFRRLGGFCRLLPVRRLPVRQLAVRLLPACPRRPTVRIEPVSLLPAYPRRVVYDECLLLVFFSIFFMTGC